MPLRSREPLRRLGLTEAQLETFCAKWKVRELAFFGSVLREDFHADSDVDVLVSFSAAAKWGLFDHMAMEDELSLMVERPVDLVTRASIERSENYLRRRAILGSAEVVYAA